jgi:DNA adenine methylase Dam
MEKNNLYVVSPLNYPGNKFRILDQLYKHFPKSESFLDLFCGSATVGINSKSSNIICVDSDEHVISLLNFFKENNHKKIIKDLTKIIEKYNLTFSFRDNYLSLKSKLKNKNDNNGLKELNHFGFYKLREDYNSFRNKFDYNSNLHLYLLLIYGFNANLRFNKKGNFNLPVGKTDLNKSNISKIIDFSSTLKEKNVTFICASYNDSKLLKLINNVDFIYLDPPYLITKAVYNESGKWTNNSETELLKFMDKLIEVRKNFGLSNVISKKNVFNNHLVNWIQKNNSILKIIPINYHYRSSSYNKLNRNSNEKEVLILSKYV